MIDDHSTNVVTPAVLTERRQRSATPELPTPPQPLHQTVLLEKQRETLEVALAEKQTSERMLRRLYTKI